MDPLHHHRVRACRCLKQDIPEVEAVLAYLVPRLESWWTDAIADALYRGNLLLGSEELTAAPLDAIDRMSGRTRDGRTRIDIERELTDAIMSLIRQRTESLPTALAQEVRESRDTLLADAIAALALSLTVEQIRAVEARLGPLSEAAVADIETLMAGRVTSREREVRAAVQRVVRSRLAGPVQALGAPGPLDLKAELERLLGSLSPRSWVTFVADQWSYRWFNINQFVAARADGVTNFVIFNNPPAGPDSKTTPFCREIHGRRLDVSRIEQQILAHVRAAVRHDVKSLMENWPLLPGDVAGGEGPGSTTRRQMSFPRVGLPPYHARCRTVVQPVQL